MNSKLQNTDHIQKIFNIHIYIPISSWVLHLANARNVRPSVRKYIVHSYNIKKRVKFLHSAAAYLMITHKISSCTLLQSPACFYFLIYSW